LLPVRQNFLRIGLAGKDELTIVGNLQAPSVMPFHVSESYTTKNSPEIFPWTPACRLVLLEKLVLDYYPQELLANINDQVRRGCPGDNASYPPVEATNSLFNLAERKARTLAKFPRQARKQEEKKRINP
jgi:hypothetical protein